MNIKEIWKMNELIGLEVSNTGKIRGKKVAERKFTICNGYYTVQIKIGKRRTLKVHRIVYETFNGKVPDGLVINHKDYNRLNNSIDNLEAVTRRQNNIHGQKNRGNAKKFEFNKELIKTGIKDEVWKPHPFLNKEVSNLGRIRNKNGKVSVGHFSNGYLKTTVYTNRKRKSYAVHRLVYETFIGLIPDKLVINHKDGVKINNCLDNLECVTSKYNNQHAINTGLTPASSGDTISYKLKSDEIKRIYSLHLNGLSNLAIAKEFGTSKSLISAVLTGRLWGEVFYSKEGEEIRENRRKNGSKIRNFGSRDERAKIIFLIYEEISKETPTKEIAEKFDVSVSLIRLIKKGEIWKKEHAKFFRANKKLSLQG